LTIHSCLDHLALARKSLVVNRHTWSRRAAMLTKVEHDLWFRSAELDTVSGLLNLLFGFGENLLEMVLKPALVPYARASVNTTNLKIDGEVVHLAAIFIVLFGVAPNETDFLLKSIPCLEVSNVGRRRTAMDAFRPFRNALEGYWMSYDFVVVLESARW
jgi:hypothetical protein